jgi:hypothetical protein
MVQALDLVNIFNYLFEHYQLTDSITVKVENAVPVFQYIWPVEGSNLTFKFESIQMFEHAYTMIQTSNIEIECITYKSNFISFKYYPKFNRVFLATEDFITISHLHNLLNQEGVKEILYKFTNYNN